MATEQEVKNFVRSKRGGAVEKCYPSTVLGRETWEVWVYHEDEYKTRFVVENSPQELIYFGEFQQFCPFVERLFKEQEAASILKYKEQEDTINKLKETINNLKEIRHGGRVKLYVGVFVFLCGVGMLLFLIYKGAEPNLVTFPVLASLIATGGYMIYGSWRQVNVPRLGESENQDEPH